MAVSTCASSPGIEVEGLRFAWPGARTDVIDIAGLTIPVGENLFLHGPSGSGKSTLLSLLGAILVPDSGVIRLLGTDIGTLSASRRDRFRVDHLGFIFQQFNLIPYLSAIENVLLPCRFSLRRRARALDRDGSLEAGARRLLEALDLAPAMHRSQASRLSVGQQQRVAAARALIGAPEILIADEPTSALDAARQEEFLALLLAQCGGADSTLVFVSHDLRLANLFSRRHALGGAADPAVGDASGGAGRPTGAPTR